MKIRAFAALLCVVLSGCGHIDTHAALVRSGSGGGLPLPHARPVALYMGPAEPSHRFEEIAVVQAIGVGAKSTMEDVAQALSARAAALGCDAVLRIRIDVGYTRTHGAGICVVWLRPAEQEPPESALSR
jgi:hypothetical protein